MNSQKYFDNEKTENQNEYQEIHPEFKTDYTDIKMNRSGYPDFKDLPLWHKMIVVLFIIFCIPLGTVLFLGIVRLFTSGAIFYLIPIFVLGCLVVRVMCTLLFPSNNTKK
ncbi:MAG: hypothetical protein Q4A17_14325 [Thermoguttaceae bacterium]|nr:hypothetical protein [Thermoguttaceae bacterium]